MSSQTFFLELKNGTLVIPTEAIEYLNQCRGEIEVSLTIESTGAKKVIPSPPEENFQRDYQKIWNR